MSHSFRILNIYKNPSEGDSISACLKKKTNYKLDIVQTSNASSALKHIQKESFDLLILNLEIEFRGNLLLDLIYSNFPKQDVIVFGSDIDKMEQGKTLDTLDYIYTKDLNSFHFERSLLFSINRLILLKGKGESEKRYHSIFEASPESILLTRFDDGKIQANNSAFSRIFGWKSEECVGKSTVDIGLWPLAEERQLVLSRIPTNGRLRNQRVHFKTKDENILPCNVSFSTYESNGIRYLMGMIVSMEYYETQKRELELEKQRYRALVESAPDLFFYSSTLDKIEYVCPQVKQHLGYDEKEVIVSDYRKFLSDKSLNVLANLDFGQFLKQRQTRVFRPFELKTKSGQIKPYELYLIPVEDPETGRVQFIQGIARDISEELETYRMLELSNQNNLKVLEELQTHQFAIDQHNMVVVTDIDGNVKFANKNFCRFSGYSLEELKGSSTRLLNSGQHDQAFFKDLWDTVLAGDVWKGNICNRHKDGELYWLATTIIPRKNEKGDIMEFIALRTDITDLKITEQALKESESSLFNILNSNPHIIWAIDRDFKLLSLNDNFKRSIKNNFNYDLEIGEAMDKVPFLKEESQQKWNKRYQKALNGHTETYIDQFMHPVTGKDTFHSQSIYPTYSPDREIVGVNVFSQDITERQLAKESLRETNKKLKQAQKLAQVGDWSFSMETGELSFSDNLPAVLGLNSKNDLPKNLKELLYFTGKDYHSEIFSIYKGIVEEGKDGRILWNKITEDGHEIWLDCHVLAELDSAQNTFKALGIVRVVTELVKLQELEKRQKKIFYDLAQTGTKLLNISDVDSVYKTLSRTMFDWFDQEVICGTIQIADNHEGEFFRFSNIERPESYASIFKFFTDKEESHTLIPSRQSTRKALSVPEVLHFDDALMEKMSFVSESQVKLIKSYLPDFELKAVGINYNHTYQGSCFILFPYGVPDYYSDQLLETLANQSSTIIELIENRNELKRNSFVLEESLKAAQSAIFRFDLVSGFMDGDLTFYKHIGLDPSNYGPVKGSEFLPRLEESYLQLMQEKFAEFKKDRSSAYYHVELKFHCFNGKDKWFEDRAKVTKWDDEGEPAEIMGVRTDITHRKERELQLLLMESSLTNAREGILITDTKDIGSGGPYTVYINPAYSKLSGYAPEEIIGKSPDILHGPETDPKDIQRINQALKEHQSMDTEILDYRKDGTNYWSRVSVNTVFDKSGEATHFIAMIRDISAEKKRKQEMEELLLRFELATRATQVGVWDLDIENNKLVWDNNMFKLYGVNREDFTDDLDAWKKTLHPDDYKEATTKLEEALHSEAENFNNRFRVKIGNHIHYISATAKIIRNNEGEAIRMVGLNWDITQLEESRLEIEKMRQNTQALINSTKDHMWSLDAGFRLLSANDNYLNYLRENHGRHFQLSESILHPSLGDERIAKWRKLYERVLRGEQVNFESEETTGKEDRIFSVSLYPIFNEARIITGVACYSFDATEKTRYLHTIEKQNRNLKDIAWMQSHVMRAPVARVLGLVELLKAEKDNLNHSLAEIIELIETSSMEMDDVIREITDKTQSYDLNLQ